MLVAKYIDARQCECFAEVIRQGSVTFDQRPGFVLLSAPLEKPARSRDLFWVHPDDTRFVWVRTIG